MNVSLEIVTRDQMRPNVDGADWFFEMRNGVETLVVRTETLGNWKWDFLLQIHEAVEAAMCKYDGVTVEQVDAFDTEYDKTHPVDCNAGDDPAAPYMRQHCFATAIERILAGAMNVCWERYDKELCDRFPGPCHKQD